jgi:hypothetical protein
MVRGVASRVRRTGVFVAVACAAACVLGDVAAHGQTPPPSAPTGNPERAVPPPPPAQGSEAAPTPEAPAAAAGKTSRQDCERYVDALAGRDKDRALLRQPEVKAMAQRGAELVTCGAVRADSDAPCGLLDDKGSAEDCRGTRALFHELRTQPNGRSFMFDQHEFDKCAENAAMKPICEKARQAFMARDPNLCVFDADFDVICRGKGADAANCAAEAPQLKKILEAHCRAKITLNEADCDVPGDEKMTAECRRDIRARKPLAKGLKELASSGGPRDKEFAKAALDQPDACQTFAKPAVDACLHATPAAGGAGTAAPTGGTSTTVPKTPKATPPPPAATTS